MRVSRLEAVLSTDFNECSIAAAETSRLAVDFAGEADATRELSLVSDFGPTAPAVYGAIKIDTIPYGDIDTPLTDRSVELVLTPSLDRTLDDADSEPSSPVLLAVLNDDIALPVATFKTRPAGECSYVQLGQEITDDTAIISTENAPRMAYVEAVRTLLEGRGLPNPHAYASYDGRSGEAKHTRDLITELVAGEIERYGSRVEEAFAASLSRRARNLFSQTAGSHQDVLVKSVENGATKATSQYVVPLAGKEPSGQQRGVTIVLTASGKPSRLRDEPVQLSVITRENVCVPMTTFRDNGPFVSTEDGDSPASLEQNKAIHALLRDDFTGHRKVHKLGMSAAKEHLKKTESHFEKLNRIRKDTLTTHVRKSWLGRRVGRIATKVEPLRHSLDLLNDNSGTIDNLSQELGINEALERLLGPYDDSLDKIVQMAGQLAMTGVLHGQVKKQRIGKTEGHTVDIFAQVTQPDAESLRVRIEGRPVTQPDMPLSEVFDEIIWRAERNDTLKDTWAMQQLLEAVTKSDS